jgi:3'-5' exoribonuclease
MKGTMISDLTPGQSVQGVFLVQSKEVRQKKTGEPYLSLVLMDRSGTVDAKMWDNVPGVLDKFERDDFVKVRGEAHLYQNRVQLTVHGLTPIPDAEVALADFLPASRRDPEEMFAELQGVIASIQNPHLKALLESIFADPEIAAAYKRAPAAKAIHHAWLGGLIEHVLSLCTLARFAAKHYPIVDVDLLLAGVLLHDIGKIEELSFARSFGYTTEGGLLGHIQMALRLVGDKLRGLPDFPPKLRNLLEHLILSHHGQLEFGSPKLPVFPEAMLLHLLDNLDSKMETMRASLERDRAMPSEWTAYNPALERSLLDKAKYLADRPAAPSKPPKEAKPAGRKPVTVLGEKMSSLQGLFDEEPE